MARRRFVVVIAGLGLLLGLMPSAAAFHWYRSDVDGCTPNDGALTDEDQTLPDDVEAEVLLGHTTYHDSANGTPMTRIDAGESVRWDWASSHCHSVTFGDPTADRKERDFGTDLHYPQEAPDSPEAAPGLFHYPVLDDSPTLSYTHTFEEPGTYTYYCIHHWYVGMQGTVVVE